MPINYNAPPILLYRTQLDQWSLTGAPVPDVPGCVWTYAHPVGTQVDYWLGPEGLTLQLIRSASEFENSERTEILWNFSPFQPAMLGCYISADFQLVPGSKDPDPFAPDSLGNQWAAAVIVRDGEPTVTGPDTTIVGATHQVIGGDLGFGGPKVTLGAGLASSVFPPAKDVAVLATLAHDDRLTFSLGTLIDCYTGQGRSHLKTSGGYYWENTFAHPFGQFLGPVHGEAAKAITCAGCGVAFTSTSGPGTAQVLVKEFRVQVWPVEVSTRR